MKYVIVATSSEACDHKGSCIDFRFSLETNFLCTVNSTNIFQRLHGSFRNSPLVRLVRKELEDKNIFMRFI